jgi:hypothetical protein
VITVKDASKKFARPVGRPPLGRKRAESLTVTLYREDFRKLKVLKDKRGHMSDSDCIRHLIRRARV